MAASASNAGRYVSMPSDPNHTQCCQKHYQPVVHVISMFEPAGMAASGSTNVLESEVQAGLEQQGIVCRWREGGSLLVGKAVHPVDATGHARGV